MHRRSCTRAVVAAVALTALALLLVLNLSLGDKPIEVAPEHRHTVHDPQFLRTMGAVLTPALVAGNRVETLLNGDQIFPAMLAAVRQARHSITLETYIYWSGSIAAELTDALTERARHGVRVHLLFDWVGGELDDALLARLRGAGVEVHRYNPPRWHNLDQLNHRTHRRLFVVDGRIGFIGGAGIADAWRGSAQDPQHWRDTHFRVEGPVVAQMQSAFVDNWMQAVGDVLRGDAYLPPLQAAGDALAQVFTSAPGGGAESMQLMMLLSIAAAVESIDLSASYFVPDGAAIAALAAAARRGVRVRILLPGPHIDRPIVRRASRARWGALLAAGVEIHEYQPTMFHCKVLVVDGQWVSLGSANFDTRSFSLNDEANMNVHDAAFARRQREVFEHDLSRARRIGHAEWLQRPLSDKLLDWAASLIGSQL